MLKLTRKGSEVYCEGKKLTINPQSSKGPGNEVVKVDGLDGANGQKWVSLSKLKEGLNEVTTNGREVTTSSKVSYTPEEQKEVDELKSRLKELEEVAKARYVAKPKLDVDPTKMSEEERQAKIEEILKYYQLKN